jgi:hypothetical protein
VLAQHQASKGQCGLLSCSQLYRHMCFLLSCIALGFDILAIHAALGVLCML